MTTPEEGTPALRAGSYGGGLPSVMRPECRVKKRLGPCARSLRRHPDVIRLIRPIREMDVIAVTSGGRGLVAELAPSRHDHRDAVLIGSGDHFRVADRAPWLDDCRHTGRGGLIDAVAEGEEGVGSENRALGLVSRLGRLVNREKGRVDARHLAGPDADRRTAPGEDDGVRLDGGNGAPGEEQIRPL